MKNNNRIITSIFGRYDVFRHNRSLKTSQNRKTHTLYKKMYSAEYQKLSVDINKLSLTKKEIQVINEKIKKKIRNRRIQNNVYTSLITVSVIFLFTLLIIYLINY